MLTEAVSHGETKDKVLFCLARCKVGLYFWLSHVLPLKSLCKTINVYIERGQANTTSLFPTFSWLRFNTAPLSLPNREKDTKMFTLEKNRSFSSLVANLITDSS